MNDELKTKLNKVADLLGCEPIEWGDTNWMCRLVGQKGTIIVRFYRKGYFGPITKLEFSGVYPVPMSENITVGMSANKSAEKIVADLDRRFLPKFFEITKEAFKKRGEQEARKNNQENYEVRMSAALDANRYNDRFYFNGQISGYFRLNSVEHVNLELTGSAADIMEIIYQIRAFNMQKGGKNENIKVG